MSSANFTWAKSVLLYVSCYSIATYLGFVGFLFLTQQYGL